MKHLLLYILILCPSLLWGQLTKEQLAERRKTNQRKIAEIAEILNETTENKYSSLDQLKAINRQMFQRRDLLKNIQEELVYIEEEINETSLIIKALERDLAGLLKEYKLMVYNTSKSADSFQQLSYLFSSNSFNQFLSRVSYMNQYHDARQNQINQINKVRNLLQSKKTQLEQRVQDQETLLDTERSQNEQLADLRRRQSELINELRKKENQLRQELITQRRVYKQLGQLVATSVAEGMEEVVENPDDQKSEQKLSAEAQKAAVSFESLKGKMPWPVSEGFVSSKYGLQAHPVIKDVQVENIGVDIRTNNAQEVIAVFKGKVTAVTKFTGMNYLVMVQHGNYFTVYANLEKVSVRIGQEVEAGKKLGIVFTNKEKISELQFQIWRNDKNLDPEKWLKE